MDLGLTETQEMIKSSVRDLLDQEWPLARTRELQENDTGFDSELWGKMAELGWLGMGIPETYGGEGMSLTDLAVLHEEFGRSCMNTPLHGSSVLCSLVIQHAGSEEQKQTFLSGIAKGNRIFALAFTEADYGWNSSDIQMKGEISGGSVTLNGSKMFVPYAHVADDLIVAVRTSGNGDDGITLVHVPTSESGVSIRQLPGFTGDRPCEVIFKNVKVPNSSIIGEANKGWQSLIKAVSESIPVMGTFMAGCLRAGIDMSLEYAQNRIAFGVPIGSFQRVQDWILLGLNHADAARLSSYEAVWAIENDKDTAKEATASCKIIASEGFVEGMDAAHHVHGGIGVVYSYGLYAYMRQSRTLFHYLGSPEHHREILASALEIS
jgi:alkylation response protein AidB-like acyl-CoA dehydrogenase